MTVLSDQLRRRISRLRPDWDIDAVSGFIYLEGGYSNDNYRFEYGGERHVLRVPSQHRPFVDRGLEQRLYEQSAAVGMPELEAFDVESGDMISRWVPGVMLADCHPTSAELVEYLRQLHQQMPTVERVYDPLEQARRHLEQAAAPDWVQQLAARLRWAPEQLVPCHNDLNPWNVICTPGGGWVTLDWEWAGRNDPLFDLVTLHQGANLPDAELQPLCRRFIGESPAASRLNRCLTVFWLREATWAMVEIGTGNDRPEVVEQREMGLARLRQLTDGAS